MKLGMAGDKRDKLKFRHHGNMAAILIFFKQHFIPNHTFELNQTLVGGYGEGTWCLNPMKKTDQES